MRIAIQMLVICLWSNAVLGGVLSGKITGQDGEVIPGANIVISGEALPTGTVGAVTDGEGLFRFEGLPAGKYRLDISHIGYQALSREDVGIIADGELDLALVLKAEVIMLGQSVVSASRRQEKILDAPASVSVVDAREIRDRPVLSIGEHIRDLPAVDYSQTGLSQSNVVVRGFNNIFSGALLTLSDNRIARVPSLRVNVYNFIPVTNDDIERIEVVLGPGSALYGPNSSNGVMHIITRSPLESQGTNVNFGLGERSVKKYGVRHAGRIGSKLGYKISGQFYSGTDWEYVDPAEETAMKADSTLQGRDYDLERRSGALRLDYRANDDLYAILDAGYNSADNIELTGLGAGLTQGWKLGYYQARFLYKDWFAQIYQNWSDAGDTFLLRNGDPIVDNSKMTAVQVQHSASLGVRQDFTYGIDLLYTRPDTEGTVNGQNEDTDDIDELGAYLQSETALTDVLDLVLALRYDDHNRIPDAEISPRAALVFKPSESQTVRLTYNRAFATPSSLNLSLDLRSSRDPFGTGAGFAPVLGFSPDIDVRAQGTFRKGHGNGFTFNRSANERPQFRTPFAPVLAKEPDAYFDLGDPNAANMMWNLGRGGVLGRLTSPLFSNLAAVQIGTLQGLDQEASAIAAQELIGGLAAVVPEQLDGLDHALMSLNTEKVNAGDPAPFDPVSDVYDVAQTRSTITNTYELGYKGVVGKKLVLAADLYRTTTQDFVGPLQVQTPNVFLDGPSLGAALAQGVVAALNDPANAALAAAVAPLDKLQVPDELQVPGMRSGNDNGTAVDEIVELFAAGAASIPFGTVTPKQAYDPNAVMLTYRNFGEVTINGLDLSMAYFHSEKLSLTGNFSYVDETFFENVDKIADITLNAPGTKLKLGASYLFNEPEVAVGGQFRYVGAFRQNTGVFAGDVDAYSVLDLNASYALPVDLDLRLRVDISNALGTKYRTFVGAPELGRMVFAEIGTSF